VRENKGLPGPRAHQRARYVLRCARPLKPATVLFEGDDPRAYIIASNLLRQLDSSASRPREGDDPRAYVIASALIEGAGSADAAACVSAPRSWGGHKKPTGRANRQVHLGLVQKCM
jgi:hypothetical protein